MATSKQDKERRQPERPQSFSISSDDFNMKNIKNGVFQINDTDLRVWELLIAVPVLSNVWAYVCLVLNILLPGMGTILCSCLGDANMNKTQLGCGIVQFLTAPFIVGWLASIYWGILIVKKSKGDHNEIKNLLSAAKGNSGQASAQEPNPVRRQNNPYED